MHLSKRSAVLVLIVTTISGHASPGGLREVPYAGGWGVSVNVDPGMVEVGAQGRYVEVVGIRALPCARTWRGRRATATGSHPAGSEVPLRGLQGAWGVCMSIDSGMAGVGAQGMCVEVLGI